jgi:hypothetical protein
MTRKAQITRSKWQLNDYKMEQDRQLELTEAIQAKISSELINAEGLIALLMVVIIMRNITERKRKNTDIWKLQHCLQSVLDQKRRESGGKAERV